ncbi:MAG: class I SAM-dependent methyltransferase [Clostridia bacterium]|nr:class I SAM-dependent methyltransferase [Clostridia bacterium]
MRTPCWKDYEIIATGDGYKLERWGNVTLLRPDPQAIWKSSFNLENYKGLCAKYERSETGGGKWLYKGKMPEEWVISYKDLNFKIKPMGFKHTGLFPEQAVNWDLMTDLVKSANREISVLNLFAYTGGATVALAKAGAKVCHVDSSKGMVERAIENVTISNVDRQNTRFIIEDCKKFVEREIRRGKKYDAILMDPPSYGRGPNGEMWKLETELFSLVQLCQNVLSENPLFFLINSYTTGLQPQVLKNILQLTIAKQFKGEVEAYEVGLHTNENGVILPCGNSGIWINK